MVSTTSGTVAFTLDVDDIIEQALEPLGGEHQSGISTSKARRVLNLLLIQLQNKNIPLNKLDFVTQALIASTASYALATTVVDVLECAIAYNSGPELGITRDGLKQYQAIPDKTTTSTRPNRFTTERKSSGETIVFWPVPDNSLCVAHMLVVKKLEDINASFQKIDLSTRYLPLVIKWLSYELALTKPGFPVDRLQILKSERDSVLPDTFEEDRERSDFIVVPGGISGS